MDDKSLRVFASCLGCVAVLLVLSGTNPVLAVGAGDVAAHQSRLTLAQMPKNPQRVLKIHQQLVAAKKQPAAPKTTEVVVSGQIGGMPNVWPETHPDFPWYDGQASFFLVDAKVGEQFAAHAKHHGGQECAFCRKLAAKNSNAIAVVNLVDEDGKILRVDARELLDLKEKQTVVVRGTARLLSGRLLVIDAQGIYLKR